MSVAPVLLPRSTIRTGGTPAPCFPGYNAGQDWGTAGSRHFDREHFERVKEQCRRYDASRAIRWALKKAARGFQRTTGGFED